jgi:phosphonoacetate hydrolase
MGCMPMPDMPPHDAASLLVNRRRYKKPSQPTVVVCVDGCEPDYLAQAVAAGHMPWLRRTLAQGVALLADCALPSFTNPNNLSIVTGVPPSVHGISGNYFLDPATGQAVMMNDPQWLRCPTLLAQASRAGWSVAVVTAKDKLRTLLGHGLQGICFSAECADAATMGSHGIDGVLGLVDRPLPSVYSADLSEFVFAAGVRLMQTRRPELMYLSTTDYVQHKHAPGTPAANAFYAMLDGYMAQLECLGCIIALTADHGMQAKTRLDGTPLVVYLADWLHKHLQRTDARVILPITDPYVVHHGALGAFATVYLPGDVSAEALCEALAVLPGIESALVRADAARLLELPADRIGDVVVLADRFTVLGSTASAHDVSGLDAPLRSHGGRGEQRVPLIVNRAAPLLDATRRFRNFDVLDIALNYAQ